MSQSTAHTAAVHGIEGVPVEVHCDLVRRLPRTTIVGLPAMAVRETAERARSAIAHSGLEYPKMRVIIEVTPDVPKYGTHYDLAIAMAILGAQGDVGTRSAAYIGELGLDGRLRSVRGVLAMVRALAALATDPVREGTSPAPTVIVPAANLDAVVGFDLGVEVLGAHTLSDVVAWARGEIALEAPRDAPIGLPSIFQAQDMCFSDVQGHPAPTRALEIAAAGGHPVLLVGVPGSGKTMLAARLSSILPEMTPEEALETATIHDVVGLGVRRIRPFRAPHHTVSTAGLLGGARTSLGETALAHNGVLFLDELPEFSRGCLGLLERPLREGRLTLSRASGTVTLPSDALLVAAMNPCPCGWLGDSSRPCSCEPVMIERYAARASGRGGILFDLCARLERSENLGNTARAEPSASIRERVTVARAVQTTRQGCLNAKAPIDPMRGALTPEAIEAWSAWILDLGTLSLLRVARTIADLDGSDLIDLAHLAEALAFRPLGED
jgi:magnesium chelatase family protein